MYVVCTQADGELDLGNATVTDCIYLGYIPMDLQEDIMAYAFNLAKKADDREKGKEIVAEIRRLWGIATSLNYVKAESIAKATREAINEYQEDLKKRRKLKKDEDDSNKGKDRGNKANNKEKIEKKRQPKETATTKLIQCQQPHCIAATLTGKKPGTVKSTSEECTKCKAFHKHKENVTTAENILAEPPNTPMR